jgi:hypothetical protein
MNVLQNFGVDGSLKMRELVGEVKFPGFQLQQTLDEWMRYLQALSSQRAKVFEWLSQADGWQSGSGMLLLRKLAWSEYPSGEEVELATKWAH